MPSAYIVVPPDSFLPAGVCVHIGVCFDDGVRSAVGASLRFPVGAVVPSQYRRVPLGVFHIYSRSCVGVCMGLASPKGCAVERLSGEVFIGGDNSSSCSHEKDGI